MNPGRELDALVAEKVMGWKNTGVVLDSLPPIEQWERLDGKVSPLLEFSTDISAAWEVVEKIRSIGFSLQITAFPTHFYYELSEMDGTAQEYLSCGQQDTAPHAICLAALKAVGHEIM